MSLSRPTNRDYVSDAQSLCEAFFNREALEPDAIAYSQPVNSDGDHLVWRETSVREARQHIDKIATHLEQCGIGTGSRVGILSNTRPEWFECEMAVYSTGASVVTAYTSDSAERNGYVFFDSKVRAIVVENQEQLDKVLSLMDTPFAVPKTEAGPAQSVTISPTAIISIENVVVPEQYRNLVTPLKNILAKEKEFDFGRFVSEWAPGMTKPNTGTAAFSRRPKGEDEASIIYTSGTTGPAKGVVATHFQHLTNIRQIENSGLLDGVTSAFHVLPQGHGFGMRMVHESLLGGREAKYSAIAERENSQLTMNAKLAIKRDMREAGAEVIPVVPKMLERMRDGVLMELEKPGLGRKLAKFVVESYLEKIKASDEGTKCPLGTRCALLALEAWPLKLGD